MRLWPPGGDKLFLKIKSFLGGGLIFYSVETVSMSAASGDLDFLLTTLIILLLLFLILSSLWTLAPFGFKFTKFALNVCKFWIYDFSYYCWIFLAKNYTLELNFWTGSGLESVLINLNYGFCNYSSAVACILPKTGLLFCKVTKFLGKTYFWIILIDPFDGFMP